MLLGEMISKEECLVCRLCCKVDSYAQLDMPTVMAEMREDALALLLGQRVAEKGGYFVMRISNI